MSVSRIITGGSLLSMFRCKSESNGEIGEKKTINDMTIVIVFFTYGSNRSLFKLLVITCRNVGIKLDNCFLFIGEANRKSTLYDFLEVLTFEFFFF